MKRYGFLYDKIYDLDNIRLAHKNARKGKTKYAAVRRVDASPEHHFEKIVDMLKNKTFKNSDYDIFYLTDQGKRRQIYRLPYFPDRIIHHCIVQVLEPIWTKIYIADTSSSIKKRGIHYTVKRLKSVLYKYPAQTTYCLKLDVSKFYPSVNHNILKKIILKKIKDKEVLWLLDEIIDSAPGIPIGNYLSQHFGNLYLAYLDHYAKEILGCKFYYRYCDDIIICCSNKDHLREIKEGFEQLLFCNLVMRFKPSWQIFPVRVRGIDFIGYRFFGNFILARKRIAAQFKRSFKNGMNSLPSYFGWFKYADTYRLWINNII